MATVVLRFYGRFAFAEGRNDDDGPSGRVTALAPSYDGPDFDRHQPIMLIRRDAVALNGSTNLAPAARLVSDGAIERAECFIWDLSGRTVQVRGRQIAELQKDHGIVDLADLERRLDRTAVLNKTSLTGSTDGPTRAAIRVAGTGSTGAAFPGRCDFVSLVDAKANASNPPTFGTTVAQFADLVEFEIGLNEVDSPRTPAQLTLDLTEPDATAFTKQVVVNLTTVVNAPTVVNGLPLVKPTTPVTIGFSNRSMTLPKSPHFDLEFAQYYQFLMDPRDDRLVPREQMGTGGLGDCNRLSYIPYKCPA